MTSIWTNCRSYQILNPYVNVWAKLHYIFFHNTLSKDSTKRRRKEFRLKKKLNMINSTCWISTKNLQSILRLRSNWSRLSQRLTHLSFKNSLPINQLINRSKCLSFDNCMVAECCRAAPVYLRTALTMFLGLGRRKVVPGTRTLMWTKLSYTDKCIKAIRIWWHCPHT